jgi:hypothetical protein
MALISLNSSCILAVGYDESTGDLDVRFPSGRIYTHHGVPLEVYRGLINASSVGRYYNANIRGRYN